MKLTSDFINETITDMRRARQPGWANLLTRLWFDNTKMRQRIEVLRTSNIQLIADQGGKTEPLTEYLDAAAPSRSKINKVQKSTDKFMKECADAQEE